MGGPLTTDLNPSAYDAFAPFYDGFTAASDYESWTVQILRLAERHGLRGRSVLDLACGTGKSFLPLLRRGYEVTGCDFSPAMLAEAAIKAPGARLVPADLRRLPALGRFDLVTCVDDSLNYLRDGDELALAFGGMAANLAPHGVLVFDLNTLRAYRSTFACDSVTEADGTVFAWRGESTREAPEGCHAAAVIEIFTPRDDGAYERIPTRHEQRHFPRAEVVELLAAAGLTCVGVQGALDDGELVEPADEEAHLKIVYIARPMEGGAAE
jgi:SAM-dependent methyltransferase